MVDVCMVHDDPDEIMRRRLSARHFEWPGSVGVDGIVGCRQGKLLFCNLLVFVSFWVETYTILPWISSMQKLSKSVSHEMPRRRIHLSAARWTTRSLAL